MSDIRKGIILVVSGPAGSGKGTVNRVLRNSGEFEFSVSRTTRKPRPGEVDGSDYFFVSHEEFDEYLKAGDFLEYNEYCGECYGTPRSYAEKVVESGKNIILEIDVNGAEQVKRQCPEAVLVMLLPPSFAEQERRLRDRGTETEDKILKKLKQTEKELQRLDLYDYIVYNSTGESDKAVADIRAIVRAERCSRRRNTDAEIKYFAKN